MLSRCLYSLFIILCLRRSSHGEKVFDLNDVDQSVRPTDDFFTFINGRWLNAVQIPPSQIEWGSIYTIKYETSLKLKGILDELTQNGTSIAPHPIGSVRRKLGDLYLAGLDTQRIEQAGLQPLEQTLIQLNELQTYQELIVFVLDWYKKSDKGIIFDFKVQPDDRNSSVNMANWMQTGVLLPERGFYFRNDPRTKSVRSAYLKYIDRLLNLSNSILNLTTSLIDAEDVLTLETQLAVSHETPVEQRDQEKNYHQLTVVELDRMMPNLGWQRLLNLLGIFNSTVLVSQPDYYQSLDKLIASQPLSIWKNKIRFTILHEMANYLPKDFVDARFLLFDQVLYGRLENKPRWMVIIDDIDQNVDQLLGQLYVERYFPSGAKQRTIDLARHLIRTYRQRLLRNQWMSEKTKEVALEKLSTLNIQIGYPAHWRSYESVVINRTSYFQSMLSVFGYPFRKKLTDLCKPVDKDDWILPAQMVNAFYHPARHQIIFPAGILQKPFFAFNADDAANYGGIGSTIAHELTHGFDDQGSKIDQNGNLRSWWTPEDIFKFESKTQLLVEQYDSYQILGTHVNGQLTLGENIADLGGVAITYEAFSETYQAKQGYSIDGLTPQERFFYAYAYIYRMKFVDRKMLVDLKIDPHAPPQFRVNGALSNTNGFYQTFNVTEKDQMFRQPSERVVIW